MKSQKPKTEKNSEEKNGGSVANINGENGQLFSPALHKNGRSKPKASARLKLPMVVSVAKKAGARASY